MASALRLIIEQRPLLLMGLPGLLFGLFGITTGILTLLHFNDSRYFSMPLALVTLGFLALGTLLSMTSIMLYAIARLNTRNHKEP